MSSFVDCEVTDGSCMTVSTISSLAVSSVAVFEAESVATAVTEYVASGRELGIVRVQVSEPSLLTTRSEPVDG